MKKIKYFWIAVVLGTVIFLWPDKWPSFRINLFPGDSRTDEIVEENQVKIDSLKRVISQYAEQQARHDAEISELTDSLTVLNREISLNQSKIVELKRKANEKANNVSSFNSSDIVKFLSDRYADSTNVKR